MATSQLLKKHKKIALLVVLMFQQDRKTIGTIARQRNLGQGQINSNEKVKSLCKQGLLKEAINSLQIMDQRIEPSTYSCLLQSCIDKKALSEGKLIHTHMNMRGFKSETFLFNTLITMYNKCGSLLEARDVFDGMPERNVISWTAMISAYASSEQVATALGLFSQMQRESIQPNHFTLSAILSAIGRIASLEQGLEVHAQAVRRGLMSDLFVGNALVDMYVKCGSMEDALHVFDRMPQQDVVSWTSIIAGCEQNGLVEEALEMFHQMKQVRVMPNLKTFTSALSACAILSDLEQGVEIHIQLSRSGLKHDILVENALVDMYAKCGKIEKARVLFDKMQQRTGISWTAMIAGYMINGNVEEALKVFQEMPEKITAPWTAMIAGYAHNGHCKEAVELYQQMELAGVRPELKTFVSVLPACGKLAALEQGKKIHKEIVRMQLESHSTVSNALMDMYAKCGSIKEARCIFDKMQKQDGVSWTSIIGGYGMNGCAKEALNLFEQMQHSGTNPCLITFLCVLHACCHAGLVNEGKKYFDCMIQNYNLTPAMEHYGCMVDLLGRAGNLDEAEDFINKMPMKADAKVLGSLLAACRVHKNVDLGERVANHLFELNPENDFPYVLLSNIYASVGNWGGIEKVRKMMKEKNVKKNPGCSWIEVNRKVHTFLVGDRSHPQTEKIYHTLKILSMQMKVLGYVPDLSFVLNDVEEEQKELILSHHSEKLAIAFGFMNTHPGTIIRVTKNLRICGDCHTAGKFISKIISREIILRDNNRYHHFKDGKCSCGDFW